MSLDINVGAGQKSFSQWTVILFGCNTSGQHWGSLSTVTAPLLQVAHLTLNLPTVTALHGVEQYTKKCAGFSCFSIKINNILFI